MTLRTRTRGPHPAAEDEENVQYVLSAYFEKRRDADRALWALEKRRVSRAAVLFRTPGGELRVRDLFVDMRRILAGILSAVFGAAAAAIPLLAPFLPGNPPSPYPFWLGGAAGVLLGIATAYALYRRSRFGIERAMLAEHARWLLTEESVLLLRAPLHTLRDPQVILREIGEIQPTIFLHFPQAAKPPADLATEALLSHPQLQRFARRLAAEQRVQGRPARSGPFLPRIEEAVASIHRICLDLADANRLEQPITVSAEWLLDNEYIVEGNANDIRINLPRRYFQELPLLDRAPYPNLPRIFGLASEFAGHVDLRVDRENLQTFLDAYQTIQPLTIGELWALPQMLRAALIDNIHLLAESTLTELQERETASFWANRLISANRRDPGQLFAILASLTATLPVPSEYFCSQLISYLYDESNALAIVQNWLDRILIQPLGDLTLREQNRQTRLQISMGNAFTSLRQLALMDWRKLFEATSLVEKRLRTDPAGIYPRMDFETRDHYRRKVEQLARESGRPELAVADLALELAARGGDSANSEEDDRLRHIGFYLLGDGRRQLSDAAGCRRSFRCAARLWLEDRHPTVFLVGAAGLFTLLFLPLAALSTAEPIPGLRVLLQLLLAIPVSQIAVEALNFIIPRLVPPRTLPKMDFETAGVPDPFATLVVVPMMLSDKEVIQAEVERLEIRYLGNRDPRIFFSLFSDFEDAGTAQCPEDGSLLEQAAEAIRSLNRRYEEGRFFLFHRGRRWSESERRFIGRERKRGKIGELHDFLLGLRPPEMPPLVHAGSPENLAGIRFIITLDSDTLLPPGSARRMIETLAHPLNQPRIGKDGCVLPGTYTILQPRVSSSLPSSVVSPFSWLYADPSGIDPYTQAVSDVYQDLTGEGSFNGKGIYDLRTFQRILAGRFPRERLLSHDLIEGEHVHTALVTDIELFDDPPSTYYGSSRRQHRWIRGDWQIVDWLFPRVPLADGKWGRNILPPLSRWKIFDNLRRSLVPISGLALLAAAWTGSAGMAWTASLVMGLVIFARPIVLLLNRILARKGPQTFSQSKFAFDLLRSVADAALLPHQAWLASSAIVQVANTRFITHRGYLRWTPAQTINRRTLDTTARFVLTLTSVSALSGIGLWALFSTGAGGILPALPWLAVWFLSPIFGGVLNIRFRPIPKRFAVSRKDRLFLRSTARRTWRYFSDFIGEFTGWLPPDNFQVSHQNQVAMRTSPTNIGLGMLSTLAARDFGYATQDDVIRTLSRTMHAVESLEHYNGHLFNWYELPSMTPLEPRYVSTVDSGNLLVSLYCLESGIQSMLGCPVLDRRVFSGLADTIAVLRQVYAEEKSPHRHVRALQALAQKVEKRPARPADAAKSFRAVGEDIDRIVRDLKLENPAESETSAWADALAAQSAAGINLLNRYLAWLELLAGLAADPADLSIRNLSTDLPMAPSLADLAVGNVPLIRNLQSLLSASPGMEPATIEWIEQVLSEFQTSQWLAGEMLGMARELLGKIRSATDAVDMRFLFDRDRKLFSVGFNINEGRLDKSYYDLLASESRLGSYVAVSRGEVSVEHWFSLGRLFRTIGRRQVLVSWTGTMFEYLMPTLFQRSYENSLLDRAVTDAVAVQIDFGRRFGIPWGLSESAFGDLDINRTYQYKAFGVPALGLKRWSEAELVVAPYASLLAVNTAPGESVRNLRRLAALGLLAGRGFYDAIDFTRRPERGARRGIVIRTYMTHHQSMGFLSLANFLLGNTIQRYFHSSALLRASELLLQEKIPLAPPSFIAPSRETPLASSQAAEAVVSEGLFDTPNTPRPRTQLLGGESYNVMVTNAGGGYSRWNQYDITRWRSDRTRDPWGTFCYLRDTASGKTWSNTYQPIGGDVPENFSVLFAIDRVSFRRRDEGIDTATDVFVSAEDDVEIRRITLINRSLFARSLDLTSYIEPVLAPHAADLQHPAFQKLFIHTEAVPAQRALVAWRRPRNSADPPIFVAHRWTLHTGSSAEEMHYETDRRRFIGRGHTLENPMGLSQTPANFQGYTLDPILSIRERIVLEPGQRVQVSMILAAGESREKVLALAGKYGDPHAVERAADYAWASAQLELRSFRIHPDDVRQFQKLASHLLYVNPLMRPPSDQLERNVRGQSGLWAYGISGDFPILLATIGELRDLGLIRQLLQAHSYWRKRGFWSDLVILNEEAGGYERPLQEELSRLIRGYAIYSGIDQPGGIFLRDADHIPAEDQTLMRAAASVVIVAARGALPQQLGVHLEVPETTELIARKRPPREPSALLPFLELPYFNSLGGFSPDGREYAVYLGPETHTPAPWVNVMANPRFGSLVSESGAGFTWADNSQQNRLTGWSNDPVLDPPSEVLYIRDDETGIFWTPTASPIREGTAYRARHGSGYTVFEHNSNGIEQELTALVPLAAEDPDCVKLQRLRLKNATGRRRRLTVLYYVEWTLGEQRENTQMHIATYWDETSQCFLARNRYHPVFGDRVAFVTLSPAPESYSGDRMTFVGRNRTLADPDGMSRQRRSRRVGARLDPCAALQISLVLDPGETSEVLCLLGQAASVEEVRRITQRYREEAAFETAFNDTRARWDDLLGGVEIHTPELSIDFLVNRWLLYQTLSCRIWGRSAVYQSGGAFGFRDQLQDCLAHLYTHPEIARSQILTAAGRQFTEGDVQHWWHPPLGYGVRTRISDDPLWLPFAVARYVRVTGDASILQAEIPFLTAPALGENQTESFSRPDGSADSATLFEHCRRAVDARSAVGEHGLPLMGTGDWDDGLNLVGAAGRGESVWLAWFLAESLKGMAELAECAGRGPLAQEYRSRRKILLQAVEASGWDGRWYLRAFFDDGTELGTARHSEARIFSLPQSWSVVAGADPDRAGSALESAWQMLVHREPGLAVTLDPPFDSFRPFPGYIQAYPPGIRENGGQYTHAALWLAMAFARRGEGERAVKILRMLNPVERTRGPEAVWRYGLEPYVTAADVYSTGEHAGRGGWSWYTGSAGWMYRVWVEEILGLDIRAGRMRVDPTIPAGWDGFQIRYRYGEAVYEIQVENPEHIEHGVLWTEWNGKRVEADGIPLEKALVLHRVLVHMGKG